MEKNARAKFPYDLRLYANGEFNGVTVDLEIKPDQKWKSRLSNGYVILTRKGGLTLRLTQAAFHRLFELREEE